MHPVLIRIGSFELRTYGLAVAIGLLVGLMWSKREFQRRNLPVEFIGKAALAVILIGIFCARLLYVALNWSDYISNPLNALNLRSGGLSLFGALIGGIASLAVICKLHRIDFWAVADALSQGYMLAYAFGRAGCFFNGCCIGSPTNLPWAMRFLNNDGTLTQPSHPVPLYEVLGALLTFVLLRWLQGRSGFTGQETIVALYLHLSVRFVNEFFRMGVSAKVAALGLTQAQLACIAGLALIIFLHWQRKVKGCAATIGTQ